MSGIIRYIPGIVIAIALRALLAGALGGKLAAAADTPSEEET